MAGHGQRKLPDEVREQRGTAIPCRAIGQVVEYPHVLEVPDPPVWLTSEIGQDFWRQNAPNLFSQRIMTEPDIASFGHLCQLHGKTCESYFGDKTPNATNINTLRMLFAEFGMTPASRTKVRIGEMLGQKNPFEKRGRKPKQ